MKSEWESVACGVAATGVVNLAGVEDFVLKLISAIVIASVSSIVVHFVRRWLRRREWSRWAKTHEHKPK